MNLSITLFDEFGSFCADGEKAARFRFERIDPYVETAEQIHFDFAGVRNMSSSFCTDGEKAARFRFERIDPALCAGLLTPHPRPTEGLRFLEMTALWMTTNSRESCGPVQRRGQETAPSAASRTAAPTCE